MIQLYQFPISHYCEKIRWALEFKGLAYQKVNLIPGLHIKKMKQLSNQSSVPVLQDGKAIIYGSSNILDYLDTQYPHNLLTPNDKGLSEQAHEWESFADQQIGIHVRRICYHTLLEHPLLVRQFFCQDGPWYGPIFIRLAFTKLAKKMRLLMNINASSVEESKAVVASALQRINERLHEHNYLVGEQFSRADLSIASLFAPFCKPEEYGLRWPNEYPEELKQYIASISEQLSWLNRFYRNHR